jgi:ketosteroid isomerase-like protein
MSQENVELVYRAHEAFNRRDLDAFVALIDPEAELIPLNVALPGVTSDGLLRALVVLFMRERGRSASGLTMDERHADLYTLRDGKIVRRQGFSDPNEALEAAGLSE